MNKEKKEKRFSYPLLGWILLWTAFGVGLSLLFKFRGVSAPWANGFAPANFLIFITLIYYLTRERFRNFLAQRKEQITRNIEEAKQAYEQVSQEHQKIKSRWENLQKELERVEEIIQKDGELERNKILEETQRQIERIKNEAEFTSRQELKTAQAQLKTEIIKLALAKAEQILKQELTPEKDTEIQEQFLKEVAGGELG